MVIDAVDVLAALDLDAQALGEMPDDFGRLEAALPDALLGADLPDGGDGCTLAPEDASWEVSKYEVTTFLRAALSLHQRQGVRGRLTDLMQLTPVADGLTLVTRTPTTWLRHTVTLQNAAQRLDEALVVSVQALATLIQRCGPTIVMWKQADHYWIQIERKAFPLCPSPVSPEAFAPPEVSTTPLAMPTPRLLAALRVLRPIAFRASAPPEQYLYGIGTALHVTNAWSVAAADLALPGLCLHRTTASLVEFLATRTGGETISIGIAADAPQTQWLTVDTDTCALRHQERTAEVSPLLLQSLAIMQGQPTLTLPVLPLLSLAYLAVHLRYAAGKVHLNVTPTGELLVRVVFRGAHAPTSTYTLSGEVDGPLAPLAADVPLDAGLLLMHLRACNRTHPLTLQLSEEGMGLTTTTHRALVLAYAPEAMR